MFRGVIQQALKSQFSLPVNGKMAQKLRKQRVNLGESYPWVINLLCPSLIKLKTGLDIQIIGISSKTSN